MEKRKMLAATKQQTHCEAWLNFLQYQNNFEFGRCKVSTLANKTNTVSNQRKKKNPEMASGEPVQSIVRHCGFCLQVLEEVRLCGGCKKRAYCSTECQAKDWNYQGEGQSHKIW